MKKRLAILTLVLLLARVVQAQIFLSDDGYSNRSDYNEEEIGVMPYHQVVHDQGNYVPLGGGLMALSALGAAYLLRKHSKKESHA